MTAAELKKTTATGCTPMTVAHIAGEETAMNTEIITRPSSLVIDADGVEVSRHSRHRDRNVQRVISSISNSPVESQVDYLRSLDPEGQVRGVTMMLSGARTGLLAAIAAQSLPGVVEFKAKASAVEVVAKQLKLSREIQDDATEFVRRAERGLGSAIREGQSSGEIRSQKQTRNGSHLPGGEVSTSCSPSDFAPKHELVGESGKNNGIYAMTDGVTDEHFNDALAEARAEGNLSRANVARKCKAKAKPPTEPVVIEEEKADEPQKKVRKTAGARRVMEQLTITINTFAAEISTTDPQEVDAELHRSDIADIRAGLGAIKKFLASVENNERKEQ